MRIRSTLLALVLGAGPAASAQLASPSDTVRLIHRASLGNPALTESSGLARSRRTPDLFWSLNDSGNPPELFATDTAGTDIAVFRVEGARNRDWEALAAGRCGTSDCLYIADIGDNNARADRVTIYRVIEPAFTGPGRTVAIQDSLTFRYEDGPRDAEALLVTDDQDIYVISKERSGGGRVYRLDRTAWGRGTATAGFVQELPLPEGLRFQITDASLAANGVDVAIRTYSYIFFFELRNRSFQGAAELTPCYAAGLDIQGEGIAWLDRNRLATTSERRAGLGGTISIVECR
jgi:hypothetical protein